MWPNPKETTDLVIFTEEILNGKLYYLCRLNFNELVLQSKKFEIKVMNIWNLSNGIRTHNHIICKPTLKQLVKLPTPVTWQFA